MRCSRRFLFLAAMLTLHGCAFVDQRVDLTYGKVVRASGGSGELMIAPAQVAAMPRKDSSTVIGDVRNGFNTRTADVLTASDIGDWVNGALIAELGDAGYAMRPVRELPKDVVRGIQVYVRTLHVDNGAVGGATGLGDLVGELQQLGAVTDLTFAVTIWRDGARVKVLDVAAKGGERYEDVFSAEKKAISLRKALQAAMRKAVPEIQRVFEGPSQ